MDIKPVVDALTALRKRIKNLKDANKKIGDNLLSEYHERFDKEISPDGVPWAKSPLPYLKCKRKKFPPGNKTLVLTGEMKNAAYIDYGKDYVELIQPKDHGHQEGLMSEGVPWCPAMNHPFKLYKREHMGFQEGDAEMIIDIITEELGRVIQAQG